ncbi:medium chain dehydrogenase/reductase family protein [Aneurinibacillus sp. Ricciae_BoGa-3]|uniref:medium chain dehydrogenase/reductase family protein n=1 Tax=Aneurinibacillus sp. Ricciae_BoGa-3 TaxID=3022697 RepID=UPI0023411427|nr:medium chain dehydrogenase/reductase family protein [Aneurinibacillus sp. Ricciae_BoGa-3]WCK56223.1 medium chain dehydrogenase/reductase family protein [Aneurinibacillus sp. Ricciae_BoGa-3]
MNVNKKIIATAYGDPDVLKIVQEPIPQPGQGELLIRVEAAGVALGDVLRRRGVFVGGPRPPFTPGYDVVGRVEKAGDSITCYREGDRVAVCLDGVGGYSHYVCVPVEEVVLVPKSLDSHEAVSLVLNYVTAYQLLHRAVALGTHSRILIQGAAGGVGTAMLQVGQLLGLTMIGTASQAKLAAVSAYGATAIDYRAEDFVAAVRHRFPEGIDAVFDPIGGDNWYRSAQTLKPGGTLIGFGFTSALTHEPESESIARIEEDWRLLSRGQSAMQSVHACTYSVTQWKKEHPNWFKEDLHTLFDMLLNKQIKPILHSTFPLQEAAEAHRLIEHSKVVGKITLDCSD